MKNIFSKRIYKIELLIIWSFLIISCQGFLDEEVFTQYDPNEFLQTEEGINSVLVSAYSAFHTRFKTSNRYYLDEFTGDVMWQWGGGAEAISTLYINYTWDAQEGQIHSRWLMFYRAIRNANSLLDNIDNVTALTANKVNQYKAEARFIRAASYYYLWETFGPVPLITTLEELNLEPTRPSELDFRAFITEELTAAANDLPMQQELWGKATKGAALSLLGKFYLNTHQWQQAADLSKQVMDLGEYELYSGDLSNMFSVENEENSEVIFSVPAIPTNGMQYMVYAFPPNYPVQSNWQNFGNQFCIRNEWVSTYHPDDERLGWFLFSYTDVNGNFQDLRNPESDGKAVRCFKFVPDPDAIGDKHGNDVPIIRYTEVLLNRAEALNELNGPNQESVDLLNLIRERAGVPLFEISDFPDKSSLRDALLQERGWEFVAEGFRRIDLKRHGKQISNALKRGITNASENRTIFPIPQREIDANPNLEQNPGY